MDDIGDYRRDLTLAFVQSLLDVSLIMGVTAVSQMTRADRRLRPSGATASQIGDRVLINYANCVVGLLLTQWNALLRYMCTPQRVLHSRDWGVSLSVASTREAAVVAAGYRPYSGQCQAGTLE
jgi:hypothetical protein